MSRNLIHLDSTYRDRNLYPNPADFEVILSQSSSKTIGPVITTIDPYTLYTNKQVSLEAVDPIVSGVPITPLLNNATGAYSFTYVDVFGVSPLTYQSGSDSEFVLSSASTLPSVDNYFSGLFIKDNTSSDVTEIIGYDYRTHTFTVSPPFSTNMVTTAGNYLIQLALNTQISTSNIFIPSGSLGSNRYIGYLLETGGERKTITHYDGFSKIATVDSPFTTVSSTSQFILRRDPPTSLTGTMMTGGTSSFGYTGDNVLGRYVRLTSSPTGQVSYVGKSSQSGTGPTTYYITPPFTSPASTGTTFEILVVERDNMRPLEVFTSNSNMNQLVCYEICLESLILPNRVLISEYGGRIAFLPFVYVELTNVTSPLSKSNSIYSNNPNASRALFMVPIEDIPDIIISPFVKIDVRSCQIVKFKPNDNLHFRITLPNGDLFKTEESDTLSPGQPNFNLQISGLFSIRRMDG